MAESVDATVSNTVGTTHPGSSPGPGTRQRILTARVLCRCVWGWLGERVGAESPGLVLSASVRGVYGGVGVWVSRRRGGFSCASLLGASVALAEAGAMVCVPES